MMQQLIDRFPGISCAWADGKGDIHTECHGLADRAQGLPVDAQTLFPACSMAKFVTALCVMRLHEQQLLDIDAPVNASLRTWKLRTPTGSESAATIRQLLCHTAGVKDGEDAFYGHRRSDAPISLLDVLAGTTAYNNRPAREETAPGTAFEYSDAGYCVLQLMVEEVTGLPFEEAAQALVFAPMGLTDACFVTRANLANIEATRVLAAGYDGEGAPIPGRFPLCPDTAASALWGTPSALVTIGQAFIAAYQGESTFLQADTAHMMAAPVAAFPWTGLGLLIAGEDAVMTQGWGENGQCMMKMYLSTGRVAVVMTNRNPEADQAESGVAALVDALLQG